MADTAPRVVFFPQPPERYDRIAEIRRNAIIAEELQRSLSRESAQPFLLLTSPNGAVFKLVVADDGTLSATPYA